MVNTVWDKKINTARPKAVVNAVKGNIFNAVKASACWVWKTKHKFLDHANPQMDLQDQGVIDSGCSRHMTGNMSYLTNYKEINGGYVAFGGNPKRGKITRKKYGYSKNRKKMIKTGQTRTQKRIECTRAGRMLSSLKTRGKCKLRTWLCNSSDKVQAGTRIRHPRLSLAKTQKVLLGNETEKVQGLHFCYHYGGTADLTKFLNPKSSHDDGSKPLSDDGKKFDEDPRKYSEFNNQEKEDSVNSTNNVNAASINGINSLAGHEPLIQTIQVSSILTTRIHKDHPLDQVIRDLQSQHNKKDVTVNLVEHGFMSSMGELIFFLVLQVKQKKDVIFISQDKYVGEILKKFGFTEVKTASTQWKLKAIAQDEEGEEIPSQSKSFTSSFVKRIFSDICWSKLGRKRYNRRMSILCYMQINIMAVTRKKTEVANSNTEAVCMCCFKLLWTSALDSESKYLIMDEAIHKELGDSLVRAATTASSLEAEQTCTFLEDATYADLHVVEKKYPLAPLTLSIDGWNRKAYKLIYESEMLISS
ncbi:hypothetical protein Tco_1344551 [Tanacetum coccineum]